MEYILYSSLFYVLEVLMILFSINLIKFKIVLHRTHLESIILLFGQQTEPLRLFSRPKNFHVNRRKIEK